MSQETKDKTTDVAIYFDMDGVLADFDTARAQIIPNAPDVNRSSSELSEEARKFKNRLYDAMLLDKEFYYNLEPHTGALDMYEALSHFEPVILTAAPSRFQGEDFECASDAKWRWCQKHLGLKDPARFICTTSAEKPTYVGYIPGSLQLLIDDRESNCRAWEEHGGTAILHRSPAQTLQKVSNLLRPATPKRSPSRAR